MASWKSTPSIAFPLLFASLTPLWCWNTKIPSKHAYPAALRMHLQTIAPTTTFVYRHLLQRTSRSRSSRAAAQSTHAASGEPVNATTMNLNMSNRRFYVGCTRCTPTFPPLRTNISPTQKPRTSLSCRSATSWTVGTIAWGQISTPSTPGP